MSAYDLRRGNGRKPSRYDRETAALDAIGRVTSAWPGWLELAACYAICCVVSWFIPTAWAALLALVLIYHPDPNANPFGWFAAATAIGGAVLLAGFLLSDRQYR